MIDFNTVTSEFRSLVNRRREVFTFLGSAFAAMGLFLTNALEGKLPPALKQLQDNLFAFYALVLTVISLIIALRMSRLHSGIVINGILYARLMQGQTFTRPGDIFKAKRMNPVGVTFLQFVLVNVVASFSTGLLFCALCEVGYAAIGASLAVFSIGIVLYLRLHGSAVRFALQKIADDPAGPVEQSQWREHLSLSLQQANQGLLGELAFSGLMVFSCFGAMTGLGNIQAKTPDLAVDLVQNRGPLLYGLMMSITCWLELVIYLRIRVAIGNFSLLLDPTDRPFRTFRLTDSMLGYLLLSFLFCVSLHVTLLVAVPGLREIPGLLLLIDGLVLLLAISAEQLTLRFAGRRSHLSLAGPTGEKP